MGYNIVPKKCRASRFVIDLYGLDLPTVIGCFNILISVSPFLTFLFLVKKANLPEKTKKLTGKLAFVKKEVQSWHSS